jgi:hypothetical protein
MPTFAATPERLLYPVGFGLVTWVHLMPFQCRIIVA